MFLNYIQEFFVKKSLKNNLHNVKNEVFKKNVRTIGLLIDEDKFGNSKELISELISYGIAETDIKIVAYKHKYNKDITYSFPTFGKKHIDWKGDIKEPFLNEFIEAEFDLLISYYNFENSVLMMITSESKAKFKVGFSSIDKRLNRWMINTDLENYKVFIFELFKYLKKIK